MNPHNGHPLSSSTDDDGYSRTMLCCLSPTQATLEKESSHGGSADSRTTSTFVPNKEASCKKHCPCSIGNGDANDCATSTQLVNDVRAVLSYPQKYNALFEYPRSSNTHGVLLNETDAVEDISDISSNETYDQMSKCISWSVGPKTSLIKSSVINDDNTILDDRVPSSQCSPSNCSSYVSNNKFIVEKCSCSTRHCNPSSKNCDSHKVIGTPISSRSCSAIADEYEIIIWDKVMHEKSYEASQRTITAGRDENYITPATSPVLVLSSLDGFHTAPNSLRSDCVPHDSLCSSNKIENETRYLLVNTIISSTNTVATGINANGKNEPMCQNVNVVRSDNSALDTFTKDVGDSLREVERRENNNANAPIFHQPIERRNTDNKLLRLETPPFFSIDTIQYEVDPRSGNIKTVGKGSFGQVYKARFSEPMFYHLQIVVKEFDEEFTNAEEIIEEAQRLLYLQDTGYVPICYGLLCFGTPHSPTYGIVQEFIGTGMTLEQMLWDQFELPLEYWFRIALQCCDGLARFHDKGILLNDIKTNNIILEFTEYSVRIIFIDFGLATDMRGKRYKNTKSLNDFVYLAPEVRKYGGSTTIASDIYSLGYVLEQIKKYSGVQELTIVARMCMEIDPMMRLAVRSAAKVISDTMTSLGL